MSRKTKRRLNQAYLHPDTTPWNAPTPPPELVELVNRKPHPRGNALDIGCGVGHYVMYLAQQGFSVTGIDVATNAINTARHRALQAGITAKLLELDAREVATLPDSFDLVLEWGLLHFIPYRFRKQYVHDLASKVVPGGTYIVLTFNLESPEWGGGRRRTGCTGAPLYYSTMEELLELYDPYFRVLSESIRETHFRNTGITHLENLLILERR